MPNLGPLNIYNNCIAGSLGETPEVEQELSLTAFPASRSFFPNCTASSSLQRRRYTYSYCHGWLIFTGDLLISVEKEGTGRVDGRRECKREGLGGENGGEGVIGM